MFLLPSEPTDPPDLYFIFESYVATRSSSIRSATTGVFTVERDLAKGKLLHAQKSAYTRGRSRRRAEEREANPKRNETLRRSSRYLRHQKIQLMRYKPIEKQAPLVAPLTELHVYHFGGGEMI